MATSEIEIINKITEVLNGSAAEAINHYTSMVFIDGISSVILGVIIVSASGLILIKANRDDRDDSDNVDIINLIFGAALIFALIYIFKCIHTILSPEGKAIHQLIKDIRG